MQMQGAFIIIPLLFNSAWGDLLRGVDVPLYSFAGGQATLSCSFDLQNGRLYSLKWYHNGTEFYRYVPTERKTPINIKPSHKFTVTELFRNDQRVTLSLTQLSVSASGQYRCEVIAEHPSFRTEAAKASMTVLKQPLLPPKLVGGLDIYEPTEIIKIGCQLQRPHQQINELNLRWYLNGKQADSDWVTSYSGGLSQGRTGISLNVPGEKILAMGGAVKAECRQTLGPHTASSEKTLRVRKNWTSLVDNYYASGCARLIWTTWNYLLIFASTVLLLPAE